MFTGLASPSHLIIVLVIILLLFGAKRIPELAKGLGTGLREFRKGVEGGYEENEGPYCPRRQPGSLRLAGRVGGLLQRGGQPG